MDSLEDPEPDYDPTDPSTMIYYTTQNGIAAKLIGIFANQNTNYSISSLMDTLRIHKDIRIGKMMGATMIDKKGKTVSAGQDLLTEYVTLNDGTIIDTNLTLSEFLAAVDAVKDPVLNFMNLNTLTANAGVLLARLGHSVEDIGLFLNQPIIKEVCDECFNTNTSNINVGINEIRRNYKKVLSDAGVNTNNLKPSSSSNDVFSSEILAANIVNVRLNDTTNKDINFIKKQLEILDKFEELANVSDELTKFVQNTKFTASNAVSSTYGEMYEQKMKVEKYLDGLKNSGNLLIMKLREGINNPISRNNNIEDVDTYLEGIVKSSICL